LGDSIHTIGQMEGIKTIEMEMEVEMVEKRMMSR
jgi:hypothetical protein